MGPFRLSLVILLAALGAGTLAPRPAFATTASCIAQLFARAVRGGLAPQLDGLRVNPFDFLSPYPRAGLELPRTLVASPEGIKTRGYYAVPMTLPEGGLNFDYFAKLAGRFGPLNLGTIEYTREQVDMLADLGLLEMTENSEAVAKVAGMKLNRDWSGNSDDKQAAQRIKLVATWFKNLDTRKATSLRLVATTGKMRTYRPEDFDFLPPRFRPTEPFVAPELSGFGMVALRELNGVPGRLPVEDGVVTGQAGQLKELLGRYRNVAEFSRWNTDFKGPDGVRKMSDLDQLSFYMSGLESTIDAFHGNTSDDFVVFVSAHDPARARLFKKWGFTEEGRFDLEDGTQTIALKNTIPKLKAAWEKDVEALVRAEPVEKPKPISPAEVAAKLGGRLIYTQPIPEGEGGRSIGFGIAANREGRPELYGAMFQDVPGTAQRKLLTATPAKGTVRVLPEKFGGADVLEIGLKFTIHDQNTGSDFEFEVNTYALRASGTVEYQGDYVSVTPEGQAQMGSDVTMFHWNIGAAPAGSTYTYGNAARQFVEGAAHTTHEQATFGFQNMVLFPQMMFDLDPRYMPVRMQDFVAKYPTRFRLNRDRVPGPWHEEDPSRALTYENTFGAAQEGRPPVSGIPEFRLRPFVYATQPPTNNRLYDFHGDPEASPVTGGRQYGESRPRRATRWIQQIRHRFDQVDILDTFRALGFDFLP